MAWDYGQLQLPAFLGDFLQTKSLSVPWQVLAPHPLDGWMVPSQILDPPTSLRVTGMLMEVWICPLWRSRKPPEPGNSGVLVGLGSAGSRQLEQEVLYHVCTNARNKRKC